MTCMDEEIINRFEKYIDKSGECWLWTGYCNKLGYGQFKFEDKTWKAHRLSYLLANGELPPSPLVVRHKCRSRNCVNPEHLEPGTKSENELDKVRDGTDCRGEKSVNAKLTEAQVLDIRSRSNQLLKELATEFNVCIQTIWDIKNRKSWKHLI